MQIFVNNLKLTMVVNSMNRLIVIFLMPLSIIVTGCNTTAGILSGAGKDLQAAGAWVSPKEQVSLK